MIICFIFFFKKIKTLCSVSCMCTICCDHNHLVTLCVPLPLLVTPNSSPLLPRISHLFCAHKCSCPVIMVLTARPYLEDSILQYSSLFSTLTVFPPTLWCSLGLEGDYKDVLLRAECSTVTYAEHSDQILVFAITASRYKKKHLWPRLRAALT